MSEIHHDHLIDVETGNVIEFTDDELELLQKQIAERLGFRLVDHRMSLLRRPKICFAAPTSHRSKGLCREIGRAHV